MYEVATKPYQILNLSVPLQKSLPSPPLTKLKFLLLLVAKILPATQVSCTSKFNQQKLRWRSCNQLLFSFVAKQIRIYENSSFFGVLQKIYFKLK